MTTMHQFSALRHAPDLSKAAGAGVASRLILSGRALVGAHSPNLSSSSGVRAKPAFGRTIGGKQQLRSRSAAQGGDHEVVARAPVDEEGNAWEIDLADDDVRVLAKFKSLYNFVQVLEVSRRADHSLAGCRLLLLDRTGNIQSVYHPYKVITDSYYDVFATLPPLLPDGPVGILGLGAGTAARIIHHFWPHVELHGWELDPSVVRVAREYFDLAEVEAGRRPDSRASAFESEEETAIIPGTSRGTDLNDIGRLVVHVGDALGCEAPTEEGFAGLIVDMFSDGAVIPALQQPQTWQRLRQHLKPGGEQQNPSIICYGTVCDVLACCFSQTPLLVISIRLVTIV